MNNHDSHDRLVLLIYCFTNNWKPTDLEIASYELAMINWKYYCYVITPGFAV